MLPNRVALHPSATVSLKALTFIPGTAVATMSGDTARDMSMAAPSRLASKDAYRGGARLRHFGRWLALITVASFAWRVAVIELSQREAVTGDGFEWSKQGNLNAAGHWFVSAFSFRPDALRPPAWALVLSLWAFLGQHAWFRQQLLACAIGTVTVMTVGLAARRLAGDRAGLIAAAVAGGYAGLWVYERAILSETLLLPAVALMIILTYWFRERPSTQRAVALGAMCGVLAMIRSEQILTLPFLVFPVVIAAKAVPARQKAGWLMLAVVATVIVVAPWTIFNLGRFQRPVLLSNGFGAAAATGNCNQTYYGPDIGYGTLQCLPIYAKGDQSQQDTEDTHTALTYAEHHLSRLPIVIVAHEGRTFGFWNPWQQTSIDAQWMGTWVGVTRLGMVSYWALLVPTVIGGVVLRRRRVALYPLLAFVAIAAIAVIPTIGDVRYRAAAEIPLVMLAAIGIDGLLPARRAQSSQPSAGPRPGTDV